MIIASREAFDKVLPDEITEKDCEEHKLRFILCSTLAGKSLLPSFSPGKVYIKGAYKELATDDVMIAITQEKILGGEYDAILPSGLFKNNFEGKDEGENEKTTVTYEKNQGEALGKAFSLGGVLHQRLGESSAAADKGEGK